MVAFYWAELDIGIHSHQPFVETLNTQTFYIVNVDTATIAEDTLNGFLIYGGFGFLLLFSEMLEFLLSQQELILFYFVLWPRSCYVAQAGPNLIILPPQPSRSWLQIVLTMPASKSSSLTKGPIYVRTEHEAVGLWVRYPQRRRRKMPSVCRRGSKEPCLNSLLPLKGRNGKNLL